MKIQMKWQLENKFQSWKELPGIPKHPSQEGNKIPYYYKKHLNKWIKSDLIKSSKSL
jgi:hypothetical protein